MTDRPTDRASERASDVITLDARLAIINRFLVKKICLFMPICAKVPEEDKTNSYAVFAVLKLIKQYQKKVELIFRNFKRNFYIKIIAKNKNFDYRN